MPEVVIPENIDNCIRLCPSRIGGGDHYTSGDTMKRVIKKAVEKQCQGPIVVSERMAGMVQCGAVKLTYAPEVSDVLEAQDMELGLTAADQAGIRIQQDVKAFELEQISIAENNRKLNEG